MKKVAIWLLISLWFTTFFVFNACSSEGDENTYPSSSSEVETGDNSSNSIDSGGLSSSLGGHSSNSSSSIDNGGLSSSLGGYSSNSSSSSIDSGGLSSSLGGHSSCSSAIFSSSSISSSSGCNASENTEAEYCSNGTMKKYGFVMDDDGITYRTVEIGTQTWMAENLNYRGTEPDTVGVCYDNDPANCAIYGRLYNWAITMNIDISCNIKTIADCGAIVSSPHKGLCPNGWHIPSDEEWAMLINYVGGSKTAGKLLKATIGWDDGFDGQSGAGDDNFGFAALAGGSGFSDGGFDYYITGKYSYWQSASESFSFYAYGRYVTYYDQEVNQSNSNKAGFKSVRCLKN